MVGPALEPWHPARAVVLAVPPLFHPARIGERQQSQQTAGGQPHGASGDHPGGGGHPHHGYEAGYHQEKHVSDQDGPDHYPPGDSPHTPPKYDGRLPAARRYRSLMRSLATTRRWIWLVPSYIWVTLASRIMRSTGKSWV